MGDWGGRREDQVYDGKQLQKAVVRQTVDFNSSIIKHVKVISILLIM